MQIKKKNIVVAVSFLLFSCNTEKTVKYDVKGTFYISLISNELGFPTPKFDKKEISKSNLNGIIEKYLIHVDDKDLTGFIMLPNLTKKGVYITFSKDILFVGDLLKVTLYDKNNQFKIKYNNFMVLANEQISNTKIFYIPIDKVGIDNIKILSDNDEIYTFSFEKLPTTKNFKLNEDSLLNRYYRNLINQNLPVDLDSLSNPSN